MRTFHPNCFCRNNRGFTLTSILHCTAHSSPTLQDKSRRRHHFKTPYGVFFNADFSPELFLSKQSRVYPHEHPALYGSFFAYIARQVPPSTFFKVLNYVCCCSFNNCIIHNLIFNGNTA